MKRIIIDSTRIPKIKEDDLNGKELNKSHNAEEVYSNGATIQDHILKVDKSFQFYL